MVYLPPAFTESRPEILIEHIERHDFGLLVSHGENGIVASDIPFLLVRRDEVLLLQCHLARANPQADDIAAAGEALAIFQGPHAYISPSWYAAGPAVPTWNYTAVHAYGPARAISDAEWLEDFLVRLTARHEGREPPPQWRMQDEPRSYLDMMRRGIVGIEIAVDRLEGKFKLSQNRPAIDRPRIVAALESRGDADSLGVARLMRDRAPAP